MKSARSARWTRWARGRMVQSVYPESTSRMPFLMLAAFVCIVFALGGASRADIAPLLVLRPLSVIACGYGLAWLTPDMSRRYRLLLLLWVVALVLVAMQLVPLPPAVWQILPTHALLAEADRVVGLDPAWRPLSLAPDLTWNSLFALVTPLAATLMLLAFPAAAAARIRWVILAIGLASGLLGILQLIGTVGDSLPYYQAINNHGVAVGLFANRNHAAIFLACLFPILASLAEGGRGAGPMIAGTAAVVLIPLIIMTGSRAGLLIGSASLLLSVALFLTERGRRSDAALARRRAWRTPALMLGILTLGVLALAVLAALSSSSDIWGRLLSSGSDSERRLLAWPLVARLAHEQMPLGSGFGTFDLVFRAAEPLSLLSPTFFNHAHNDWMEIWLTGGVPALGLTAAALAAFAVATRRVWTREAGVDQAARLGRLGSVILLMLALASIVDYPLRTPSLSTLAAIAAVWLAIGQHRGSGMNNGESRQHDDRSLQVPGN